MSEGMTKHREGEAGSLKYNCRENQVGSIDQEEHEGRVQGRSVSSQFHNGGEQCIARCQIQVDMGRVYASEWVGGLWRTKGSDFESVVYMLRLVFPVPHLNLTSNYHLEIQRHSSQSILATRNSSEASSDTPASLQAWCHSIPTCFSQYFML